MIGHTALVVAQRHVHIHIAQRGFKANHERFNVFTGLIAFRGSEQKWRMHTKVEALIVESADRIADDLIRQFENGLLDQPVGLR